MNKTTKTLAYAVSATVVILAAMLLNPSVTVAGAYWCVSFWALVGFDFWRTQVVENGESEVTALNEQVAGKSFSFADRVIGYLFAAPFIAPAKLVMSFARS